MTRAELLALPASVDLRTGNRALGIGRTIGYALARQGEYPCRVLRIGGAYRVITSSLLDVLGVHRDDVPQSA
ncbi:hypothetical protein LO772_16520 [Yinghuangia sp. ASG 101]|uniref:hypothetical protein n=1 Tax=Yinghuangia sp. ASG 101 TaxID=2896848 RepID=UPI001E2AA808|nr:hypothetical protein [Yinghuangia sp. ASG 101]UGQ15455.1 hypothetical protein LO772_16520 [Yinghuangia sp. ASG 101]